MTMMMHTGYVILSEVPPCGRKVKIRIPNLEIFECFKEKCPTIYGIVFAGKNCELSSSTVPQKSMF